MTNSTPLSPTPSTDGFCYVQPAMMNTSHPRDVTTPEQGISDYAHQHSRYSTPVHDDEFVTSYDSSAYSQNEHDATFGRHLSGREPSSSPYHGLSREVPYNARGPYTPEASPPTPCAADDAITTRSGLNIQKRSLLVKSMGVKGGRVQKKAKDQKQSSTILTKPLSEVAKDMPNVHVADIAAFVSRSTDDRLKETSRNKKAGQIKRPMNAFMLYRKAYQDVAKTQCLQNNHQHVSKVCGAGWPMEPDRIHNLFTEWAKIERTNHQKAHPGYKFTPSKPRKVKRDGEGDGDSTVFSDADDSDWASSHGIARSRGRAREARHTSRLSEPPHLAFEQFEPHGAFDALEMSSVAARNGMYAYPTPGRRYQLSYDPVEPIPFELGIPQHPNALGIMQDPYSRTPSPCLDYSQQASSHGFMDGFYPAESQPFESAIDPSMLPDAHYGIYDGLPYDITPSATLTDQANWSPPPGEAHEAHDLVSGIGSFAEEGAHDAYLKGKQEDWKFEELDETSHFESWMTQVD